MSANVAGTDSREMCRLRDRHYGHGILEGTAAARQDSYRGDIRGSATLRGGAAVHRSMRPIRDPTVINDDGTHAEGAQLFAREQWLYGNLIAVRAEPEGGGRSCVTRVAGSASACT